MKGEIVNAVAKAFKHEESRKWHFAQYSVNQIEPLLYLPVTPIFAEKIISKMISLRELEDEQQQKDAASVKKETLLFHFEKITHNIPIVSSSQGYPVLWGI